MLKKSLFLLIIILNFSLINAQSGFPLETRYPFVKYEQNKFLFPGDSISFKKLFAKFDTLIFYGTNKITVLQIGASHTQADIFTAQLRMRLQNMYPGLSAGRGYVFPYNLIRTNSPYSYKAYHTGTWSVCRNVEHKNCTLGLTGIAATTSSYNSSISIQLRDNQQVEYSFNYIKILHRIDSSTFDLNILPDNIIDSIHTDTLLGFTEFFLSKNIKKFTMKLSKTSESQNNFTLYGIFLENTEPGIVFHPIGINGAATTSYNKCQLFEQQLKAINPDWVIIALGTNDGYTAASSFDSVYFKNNFKTLIHKIKAVNPDIAITIIVPNDDYFKRHYPNPNTPIQERVLLELAREENCAIWDMFKIMGGFNASSLWYQYGLMQYDRIHFTNAGYKHLADLFFTAFVDAYGNFMNAK